MCNFTKSKFLNIIYLASYVELCGFFTSLTIFQDLTSDNDNSGDDSKCDDQTSVPHNGSAMALETPTQDENKNLLMSHLELQSSSSDIKKDQHFTNHEEPPFHRPVFDCKIF